MGRTDKCVDGRHIAVQTNEISARAQRYKAMDKTDSPPHPTGSPTAAPSGKYVTQEEMGSMRMRMEGLEDVFDELLQRVSHLETMDMKFRQAHDKAAWIINDIHDSLDALERRVFPSNTEFATDVQKIIGSPLDSTRKTGD